MGGGYARSAALLWDKNHILHDTTFIPRSLLLTGLSKDVDLKCFHRLFQCATRGWQVPQESLILYRVALEVIAQHHTPRVTRKADQKLGISYSTSIFSVFSKAL